MPSPKCSVLALHSTEGLASCLVPMPDNPGPTPVRYALLNLTTATMRPRAGDSDFAGTRVPVFPHPHSGVVRF